MKLLPENLHLGLCSHTLQARIFVERSLHQESAVTIVHYYQSSNIINHVINLIIKIHYYFEEESIKFLCSNAMSELRIQFMISI